MKSFVVALCVLAVAAATSQDAKTLKESFELKPEGEFQHGFETDNGIAAQAAGTLKKDSQGESFLTINGESKYISPEGVEISFTYTADENGYIAQGAHLPTPPAPEPIPEYILRSLEYIQAHPNVEKKL